MRPLHSMLLLIGLVALVATAWLTLRDVRPAAPAAAPTAAAAGGGETSAQTEVVSVAPADVTRQVPEVQPLEPAAQRAPRTETAAKNVVRGLVLDPGGQPVVGAEVLSSSADGFGISGIPLDAVSGPQPWNERQEARTDGSGRFELRGGQPGEIRLAVRAAGFAPWDRDDVIVPAGGDHELVPIQLEPSSIVTGRVVDPDGRTIAGAELVRLPPAGPTVLFSTMSVGGATVATTAADGSFTVDQLPAGGFRLRVLHEDHPDQVEVGRTEVPGERLDGLTIVMDHGLTIGGRITGAPEGALGGLLVRAVPERGDVTRSLESGALPPETREAEPAADGTFLVRGVRAGQPYNLIARRKTQGAGLSGLLGTSLSPQVPASGGDRGVELPYQLSGALVFQVVDAGTRTPVTEFEARAGVSFLMPLVGEDGRTVRRHPDGQARFGNLRPGPDQRVQLEISAVGYRTEHLEDLTVPVGRDTDLGLIALDPVPLVEVTVLDDASGVPVPGARVTLAEQVEGEALGHGEMRIEISEGGEGDIQIGDGSRHTATTDEEGVARLTGLEGRAGTIQVEHRDFAPSETEPFISPLVGSDVHVVRLMGGGSVTVVMTTPDGEPLAGARLEHEAPGADGIQWDLPGRKPPVTDTDGRVTLAHLAAGVHRFRQAGSGGSVGFMGSGGSMVRMRRGGGPQGGASEDDGWREVLVQEGGEHELALVAPVRVALYGTVYEGGQPLEGALVQLKEPGSNRDPMMAMLGGGGPEGRADGRGNFRVENVEAGRYSVEVSHPTRRMPAVFDITLGEEDLERDLDLSVSVITGRVTDEAGEPLAGVRVFPERASQGQRPRAMMISVMAFSDQDGGGEVVTVGDGSLGQAQALTDGDGEYELRGVESDVDLVVRAEADSAQPGQSEVVQVAPDQTRSGVDVVLAPAGRIEVVAFTPEGEPASNLVVIAVFEGERDADRKSGFLQSGRTTLEGLSPGPWRVSLRSVGELGGGGPGAGPGGSGAIPDQVIEVIVGETTTATFTTS